MRVLEKGLTLSPPFPVEWNGDDIKVNTGRKPVE
jgi:hypothetical protein